MIKWSENEPEVRPCELVCLCSPLRRRNPVYRDHLQHTRPLAAHRAGKGAKYTRGRGPLELIYAEEVPDKSTALRREYQIKRLTRQEKERLIKSGL